MDLAHRYMVIDIPQTAPYHRFVADTDYQSVFIHQLFDMHTILMTANECP